MAHHVSTVFRMDTWPSPFLFSSVGGTLRSPKSIPERTSWNTNALRSMAIAIWLVCSPAFWCSMPAIAAAIASGTFAAAAFITSVTSATRLSRSLVAALIVCAVTAMSANDPVRNPSLGNHSPPLAPSILALYLNTAPRSRSLMAAADALSRNFCGTTTDITALTGSISAVSWDDFATVSLSSPRAGSISVSITMGGLPLSLIIMSGIFRPLRALSISALTSQLSRIPSRTSAICTLMVASWFLTAQRPPPRASSLRLPRPPVAPL